MTREASASRGPVIGAVDVGSNTIKMTVARPDALGGIEEFAFAAETVRLGAGLGTSGRLAEDRIEASLAVLRTFAGLARDHGATRLVGVATEATRRAANGPAFLQRVRAETGWDVRVISGDEEADLTFRGLALHGDLTGPVMIADIGGASTELIVATSGVVTAARSVAIGSGTLTDAIVSSDPPTVAELDACARAAAASLAMVPLPTAARLICVGGTAQYLALLAGGGPAVSRAGIERALDMCRAQPSHLLAAVLTIPPARAQVLPAGIAVIRALVDLLGCGQVEAAPSGIRTGLLLETFAAIAASDAGRERNESGVGIERSVMTTKPSTSGPDPDQEYRAAMRDAIAIQWTAVWKAVPEVIAGKDPEAVHKMRVASRRLRAAMDVATDCFPRKWYRPLHKTAKRITRALGEVRDRDVLLAGLAREHEQASDAERPGIDYLVAGISRDRKKARKAMIRFLARLDAKGVPKQTRRRFPLPKRARAASEDKPSTSGRTTNAAGVRRHRHQATMATS